jgi:hypothetical protein
MKGFIYIWMDTKRKKFYIGSHKGDFNDGYIASSKRLLCAYKSRPETFKRRILETLQFEDHKELLERETYWLSMIKPEELGKRYYNEKNVASGGDIISNLSEEKKEQHRRKSIEARKKGWKKWYENLSESEKSERSKYARSCVKNTKREPRCGEDNSFYGKTHTEDVKRKISESNRRIKRRIKQYKIVFPDGREEIHLGQNSIIDKYCKNKGIKIRRHIDTDKPIYSNRNKDSQLIGCKIFTHG